MTLNTKEMKKLLIITSDLIRAFSAIVELVPIQDGAKKVTVESHLQIMQASFTVIDDKFPRFDESISNFLITDEIGDEDSQYIKNISTLVRDPIKDMLKKYSKSVEKKKLPDEREPLFAIIRAALRNIKEEIDKNISLIENFLHYIFYILVDKSYKEALERLKKVLKKIEKDEPFEKNEIEKLFEIIRILLSLDERESTKLVMRQSMTVIGERNTSQAGESILEEFSEIIIENINAYKLKLESIKSNLNHEINKRN